MFALGREKTPGHAIKPQRRRTSGVMKRPWTLLAVLLIPFAAGCSDEGDPTPVPGDTEPGSSSGDPVTTAGTGSSSSSGASGTSGAESTETGDSADASSSTGEADACSECIVAECGGQAQACALDDDCACWLECIDVADDPAECVARCGDTPSTLEDVFLCTETECSEPCELGGGSTGEVLPSQGYEPCEDGRDCEPGLN